MFVSITYLAVGFSAIEWAVIGLLLCVRSEMVKKLIKIAKNQVAIFYLAMKEFNIKSIVLLKVINGVVLTRRHISFEFDLFVVKVFTINYANFHLPIYSVLCGHFINEILMEHIFKWSEHLLVGTLFLVVLNNCWRLSNPMCFIFFRLQEKELM